MAEDSSEEWMRRMPSKNNQQSREVRQKKKFRRLPLLLLQVISSIAVNAMIRIVLIAADEVDTVLQAAHITGVEMSKMMMMPKSRCSPTGVKTT